MQLLQRAESEKEKRAQHLSHAFCDPFVPTPPALIVSVGLVLVNKKHQQRHDHFLRAPPAINLTTNKVASGLLGLLWGNRLQRSRLAFSLTSTLVKLQLGG